jgi:PAS domain S-box-containing protein
MGWLGVDRRTRAAWFRYGAALTMVLAATLLSVLFRPLLAAAPVVIFLAAVAVSAWLGGTGPAVAAIVLSLAGISLVAMAPAGISSFAETDVRAMGVFLLVALLLVFLSERRDKADAALQAREGQLRDALEHARQAETTVAQARARAEALAEATRALTEASPGPDAVLAAVARQAAGQLGDLAVVRLVSADGRWLEAAAADHPDPAVREAAAATLARERHPADQGANGAALQTGAVLRLAGAELAAERREHSAQLWPPLPAAPTAALLAAPLRADGRVIGTLSVSRAASERPYLPEDEVFLQELADRAGLAIERARLFERIRASEERIRLAVEANRLVAWEWEPATDRFTASDNFPAIFGIATLASSAEGFALVWPEDLPAHRDKVRRIAREGGEYQSQFRITRPSDGEIRSLEEHAAALTDDAGRVTRVVGVVSDVTARRQAEEQLAASQQRLSALLEQLPVAVGLTDEQGRWVQTNALMRRFAGETLPSRDPELHPRWQTWDESGQPVAPSLWPGSRALRGETVLGMDFLYTAPSGEAVWTRVSGGPFRDAAGAVIGAINVIQDIDARKRAEEALADSEAHARFLAEASAVLAETLDYDEAVERVVHLAVPALADWCVVDLLGADGALHRLAIVHGHPDRAAIAAELRGRYPAIPPGAEHTAWKVLRSRQTWFDADVDQARFTVEARDGAHLGLLQRLGFRSELVTPLVARGEALGVLTLVYGDSGRQYGPEDVALAEELARHCALAIDNARLYREATAAEAKVRRLFDAGVIGMIVADRERIVEANDRFLEMVGYDREDLAAGRLRWAEMTPPEFDHLDVAAIAEIAERGSCSPFEKEYIRKDGSRVPILLGAAAVQGTSPPWISAVLDLTAQRAAEEARSAFVDAAAHDLKSPLTSLKGRVQLLLRRARRDGVLETAPLETGLTAIDVDVNRLVALIDELMDVAHLRTGRTLRLNLDAVDLVAVVQRCAEEFGTRSPLHAIAVDTDEPALVGEWDPSRLERVVQNLLDNAVKYSPHGGRVALRVRREADAAGADWAILTVVDEGVGIPAAEAPYIFERFRRGSNVAGIAGAGIGLAGAWQIVAQHGGTIAVESVEGEGSVFTVRLPVAAGGD